MNNYKPEDYKAIAVWGKMMGSFKYYIVAQQERAAAEGAPLTAISKIRDSDGETDKWGTVEEIVNADVRRQVIERLMGF